jgi:alanine racemase
VDAADLGEDAASRPSSPAVRQASSFADSGPVAQVSAAALAHNAALVRSRFEADALPADAWGHGAAQVVAALRDARPGDDVATGHPVDALLGLPGGDPRARPAMRLTGIVLSTKELRAGEGVSYGLTYRAEEDTTVALVTGGYAQGVVRSLGNRVRVLVDGAPRRIVGRVAMDVCVVDLRGASVARGAAVVFFGDPGRGEPSLAEWVDATGLGARELVTAVGLHARREQVA